MQPSKETLKWMYETMVTGRRFENTIEKIYMEGKTPVFNMADGPVPGEMHLSDGQEPVAVGVCAHLTADDIVTATRRPHHQVVARSVDLNRMAAEIFGKATGLSDGRGGHMHIFDADVNFACSGIVAQGMGPAAGAALSRKMQGKPGVAVASIGKGAANQGAFHEAMNLTEERDILKRAREDNRQTDLIKETWKDSGKVYGYRKLHDDLCEQGETCCLNRVARLARLAGIKARIGYKHRPGKYGGKPSVVADNRLNRQFDVDAPDRFRVTDITYIKTCEGFSYLAVVIDLYSRRVVGWAMQSRQPTDLVLQALLMAVWRRKPRSKVLIHSDQGSQFTSMDWASFLKQHNLQHGS